MELGLGGPTALPHCFWPKWQPALWPALIALVLLSSFTEASLDPLPHSPATHEDPAPVLAPPIRHHPGQLTAHLCGGKARRPQPQSPQPVPPPPPPRPPPVSPPAAPRGVRAARAGTRGSHTRATGTRSCRLRTQLVPVHALGLGHRSDELVRFRFCSGSCRRARTPHDLSLASLLDSGALKPPPGSRPVSQPCCRPTRYEAVSFMDVNSTWRTVDHLSATACGCLG